MPFQPMSDRDKPLVWLHGEALIMVPASRGSGWLERIKAVVQSQPGQHAEFRVFLDRAR
jgi:hypothetical protein